jgi:hypothetical protein
MRATRWVLLLVVGLCCLTATATWASDARVEGLAVGHKYLEDYSNLWTFPTVAARYANLVAVSLGDASSMTERSVGVIGAGNNTSYGTFAIFLNQIQRNVNGDYAGGGPWEQAQLDLNWAKQFSGATVGLGVLYTKSSEELGAARNTPIGGISGTLDNPNANQLAVTGGVKLDMNNQSMLELAAQVGWWTWEEKDASGILSEDDGKLSYMLAGRIMSEVTNQTTLVPVVCFSKMDLTEKPAPTDQEFEVSRTMVNLGVAMHHEVNGNDLLVLGISGDYVKDKFGTLEESTWSLPSLFAALEFDVYNWLTVRAGARKTFDRYTEKDPPAEDLKTLHSDFRFGLGMGLHFDHFDVDATVQPAAVYSGGYLFSGDSTNQPLTKVTATYYF